MRTVEIPEQITPAAAVIEDVVALTWSRYQGFVTVAVAPVDEYGLPAGQIETYQVTGADYADLMAADCAGLAPGSPLGRFRHEDIYPIIDRMRAGSPQGRPENSGDEALARRRALAQSTPRPVAAAVAVAEG